jgi:hypothetical protein
MKATPFSAASARRVFPRVRETLARSTRRLIAATVAGIEI